MKINWTVRIKNPVFWAQVAASLITPVFAYFGLTGADMTTWGALFNTVIRAVQNPYVVFTAAVSVWNAVNDPTTTGLTDSNQAMGYIAPKGDV